MFQDARIYQIVFLSSFLFLGINSRAWTLKPELILLTFLSCILTQIFFSYNEQFIQEQKTEILVNSSWQSSLITALGLSLLLRANNPLTMILAGTLAIASKFLFKVQEKHFFNPANFGIITTLTLTKDAWITPSQWGNDWWYLLLFIATGLMILKKVGRWDTSAVFLLVYTTLQAIRNYWLGWDLPVLEHKLMTGSLLVFAFFMLTDPRSIPNARISRIIWAAIIAILAFILQEYFYINNAIFWSLFIISPLTIALDYIWQMPRFQWISG